MIVLGAVLGAEWFVRYTATGHVAVHRQACTTNPRQGFPCSWQGTNLTDGSCLPSIALKSHFYPLAVVCVKTSYSLPVLLIPLYLNSRFRFYVLQSILSLDAESKSS